MNNKLNNPIVSVGLPVYNGENYIKESIDSILSQTFQDFELIISDNASTDQTMPICRTFAKNDHRIRYFRNEKNFGAAWNFNQVFHLARGKYFQWACHDDVWASTLLERCVEILNNMPDVALCYTNTTYINENGIPTRIYTGRPDFLDRSAHRRFRSFLEYHIHPNECNPVLGLFRTNILQNTPLIGDYPASDMILLGEVVLNGKFHEIPQSLFFRRDHPLSSVRANPGWEDRAVWFNPSQKGKIQMPAWRWFYEWFKSILRSPIGVSERAKCVTVLFNWAKYNRSEMILEMKHGANEWIFPAHKQAPGNIR